MVAGGTGGHIYPGLAIADKIKKEIPDAEITFIGSLVGMEKNIVPAAGYPLDFVRARGFERKISFETLAAIKGVFDSIYDAKKILRKYNPDLVIGTGGFTCASMLMQAAKRNIPTMIHEQNAFPGKANRLLGERVDRVAISFKEAADYFPKEKVFLAGNPVREIFKQTNREQLRRKLNINESQKLIVVMGGSQGAGSINHAACRYIQQFNGNDTRVVYHLTGRDQYEAVIKELKEKGVELKNNIHILPYSNDVHTLIGAGDLVVSRSGAMSVAEIAAVGIPSILVPYPLAAGNHQEFNARVITDAGGGILVRDGDLKGELLVNTAEQLLRNDAQLEKMRKITQSLAILDADERIFTEIKHMI